MKHGLTVKDIKQFTAPSGGAVIGRRVFSTGVLLQELLSEIDRLTIENQELRAGLLRDDARHPEGCKCGQCAEDAADIAAVREALKEGEFVNIADVMKDCDITAPGHQGCCDICNDGGCCKSDDTESEG
jgi:hypothetical protein